MPKEKKRFSIKQQIEKERSQNDNEKAIHLLGE